MFASGSNNPIGTEVLVISGFLVTSLALILESVRIQGDVTYSNGQNVKTKVRFPLALENRGK